MNSHNTKAGFAFHKTPVRTADDSRDAKHASTSLKSAELAIADDTDAWTDPYNSTGKHVILKAKLLQKDD